jgi:hypothetical protein
MFKLIATFSDGHSVELSERYDAQFRADRAAGNYIRDYSDPCGLGIRVSYVSVVRI